MDNLITDIETVQACVGKLPGPRNLKVIDHIDAHATRWIGLSPFLFAVFGDEAALALTVGGGEQGFVRVGDRQHLQLPLSSLDDRGTVRPGQSFGSLFLVPGFDETLRINGRVQSVHDEQVEIAVAECYLHCAKAFMRSGFWAATPGDGAPTEATPYLDACRFMALATMDSEGRADISPKGDPAGALLQRHGGMLCFPDRPGNRRIDSFRNILSRPRVAAIAMVPGIATVMRIAGVASITTDEVVRASFAVGEKMPKLVTAVEAGQPALYRSEALLRARLWPVTSRADDLDPVEIFKDHIKLSREDGVQAALARAAIAAPGAMRRGLDHDYKTNLY